MEAIGIVAGKGVYSEYLIKEIRRKQPDMKIVVLGLTGETESKIEGLCDVYLELALGQISKAFEYFKREGAFKVIMSGFFDPKDFFNMQPDLKAMTMLYRYQHNKDMSFFKVLLEISQDEGIELLSSLTFMEDHIMHDGLHYGPESSPKLKADAEWGLAKAQELSRINVAQRIIVSQGLVLAVDTLEERTSCMMRAVSLAKKGQAVTLVKVPRNDAGLRFGVPIVHPDYVLDCVEAKVPQIVLEAEKSIILEPEKVRALCDVYKISLMSIKA